MLRLVLVLLTFALAASPSMGEMPGNGASIICAPDQANPNAGDLNFFHPASPQAHEIRQLAWLIIGICVAIFIVVEGVLVWSIVKYRRRGGAADDAPQVYGSNPIELAWTVIPTIIVFVLTLVTIRTIREVQLTTPPEGALQVEVIAHQWWWEYRIDSPGTGGKFVTANELVVPVGRPVWLSLRSADVVHSWWVPRLNGKTDLIPNHLNHTWFEAAEAGVFLGQCAEFCGMQHANMLLRVEAVDPAQFAKWCEHQASAPVVDTAVGAGRDLFMSLACMNCHAIDGYCSGAFGPSLTHLMSRRTIGAGVAPMTAQTLRAWVDDPANLKDGCNMPSLKLSESQLDSVVSFLLTLK